VAAQPASIKTATATPSPVKAQFQMIFKLFEFTALKLK